MEEDFAATTTIGERVEAPAPTARVARAGPQGPTFGVPPKLEPFCLLAKSARGAGAAALIAQATAAPGVYVWGELLDMPSIKALATNESHAGSHRLLEIFAYGTWSDYNQNRAGLPALNSAQEVKLRHLTIVSLAMQNRIISYSTLLSTLELDSIPTLEDLLIEGFYAGVFTGRLDQHRSRVEILSSLGRDVRFTESSTAEPAPPTMTTTTSEMEVDTAAGGSISSPTPRAPSSSSHTIGSLSRSVSAWMGTISTLLTSLDRHLAHLTAEGINSLQATQDHDKAVQAVVDEVVGGVEAGKGKEKEKERKGKGPMESGMSWIPGETGGASGGGGDMDVDAATGNDHLGGPAAVTRNAKSPGGRMRKRGRT